MISVSQALSEILSGKSVLDAELASLSALTGRIAATDITAQLTQPPFAASAMDGYAVRFADAAKDAQLKIIGEAPAGAPFAGVVGAGEAVRIYTGAAVPDGADHIVIQEDVRREGDQIAIQEVQNTPRHIRAAGIDFNAGDRLVEAGEVLHEIHGAILAAANISKIAVRRRPRVVLFSNGDELMEPGAILAPGQIVNSNHYALSALIENWGGEADYLGCAPDREDRITEYFQTAQSADIIVPIGGASVGDYDFVKSAFRAAGGAIGFEKVAVRPGKPTWCGSLGETRVIGLPGNPASAIVTAALFVQPLVRRLAGTTQTQRPANAILTADLRANGGRESYLRGFAELNDEARWRVTPVSNQDSSLLAPFAKSNVLIKRAINAAASLRGSAVEIVWLR